MRAQSTPCWQLAGVGGLAVGLAGREILENLFTGLIILSSSPFEVGDEVLFTPPSGPVRCRPAPLPTLWLCCLSPVSPRLWKVLVRGLYAMLLHVSGKANQLPGCGHVSGPFASSDCVSVLCLKADISVGTWCV